MHTTLATLRVVRKSLKLADNLRKILVEKTKIARAKTVMIGSSLIIKNYCSVFKFTIMIDNLQKREIL